MTIGFRNNLFVSFGKKKWQFDCVKFFIMGFSLTGKSENLAETPILKDFFFLQMSLFSKSLVSSGDIKFLKEVFPVFEKCQF